MIRVRRIFCTDCEKYVRFDMFPRWVHNQTRGICSKHLKERNQRYKAKASPVSQKNNFLFPESA